MLDPRSWDTGIAFFKFMHIFAALFAGFQISLGDSKLRTSILVKPREQFFFHILPFWSGISNCDACHFDPACAWWGRVFPNRQSAGKWSFILPYTIWQFPAGFAVFLPEQQRIIPLFNVISKPLFLNILCKQTPKSLVDLSRSIAMIIFIKISIIHNHISYQLDIQHNLNNI